MRKKFTRFLILVSVASLLITSIEARGGGRGGGGGRSGGGARGGGARGGAYHGGNVMNRTPSMSRASTRPAGSNRPAAANRPAAQPGRNRPAAQQRPSANRQDLRNQVNRYSQNRPAGNINRQDLASRNQSFSNNRTNQISQNNQLSNQVSNRLRQTRPNSNQWFDRNFLDRHDINVGYIGNGANLWRPAAWATLATWGAWNWSTPYYYDNGGYSYPVAPTEYATYTYSSPPQPAQVPATAGSDWLPLGVFAVASNAAEAAQSNRFMQLAVNRNGEIDGVLYNAATDTAQTLTGMVDPKTQMASWSMADRADSPIASTGIYNLTEAETSINVHFTDGTDQNWTLVRVQQ